MLDFVLAADIGGTKIAVARVSHSGRISHRREIPTPAEGGRSVVEAVAHLLEQLPKERVCAVAVDVPGLACRDGHVWAPNIKGWERMPLSRLLRRRLNLPVLVESDRNAFVVGEAWKGAARNCSDVVFLIVGTGIGAGILAGGRLVRGYGELAGAVGWMAVSETFRPEYRSIGCLEARAAGPGISVAATRAFGRKITAQEVTQLARRGDKTAHEILREAGRLLGLGLANLVGTLNPEVIVIGGGVADAGDLLLETARETMKRWAQPLAIKQAHVVRSRLGVSAGLLGAAKLAFDHWEL